MSLEDRPTVAVILSLIGGALMLLSGAMMFMMLTYGGGSFGMMGGFGGMMGGYQGMMGSFGVPFGFMVGLSLIGLVSGILVIIGAVMLDVRPAEHTAWGIVILVFSIISFLGTGGFFIGAILGTIGGAFSLAWKPRPELAKQANIQPQINL